MGRARCHGSGCSAVRLTAPANYAGAVTANKAWGGDAGPGSWGRGRRQGPGRLAACRHALHARAPPARSALSSSRYFDKDRHEEPVRKPTSPGVPLTRGAFRPRRGHSGDGAGTPQWRWESDTARGLISNDDLSTRPSRMALPQSPEDRPPVTRAPRYAPLPAAPAPTQLQAEHLPQPAQLHVSPGQARAGVRVSASVCGCVCRSQDFPGSSTTRGPLKAVDQGLLTIY